jgi:gluconolactonase
MKIRILTAPLVVVALAAAGAGCDRHPGESAGEVKDTPPASGAGPLAVDEPRQQTWSCPDNPGVAPSGERVAERIPAADTSRDAPGLYEGPVWIDDALYFSDFTFEKGFPSRIRRLTLDGKLETAIEDSGSNGLAVDIEGFIVAATHHRKAITRYNPHTAESEVIADTFEGNPFNSPNDLAITHDGIIYFTDPDFQRSAAPGGQPRTRVYRIAEDGVTVVDETMVNPNGVSLSPAQDVLYVAGGGEQGVLRAYPIVERRPGPSRDIAAVSVPDGMAIDCLGNIYVTEHLLQRIRVFSPDGEQIATIKVDANVTNAAFGGPDRRTLYITGAGAVWKLELNVAGLPY